jgi:hypothetical protein
MRRPNRNPSLPADPNHGLPAVDLEFTPSEYKLLERNKSNGGYQGTENMLLDLTDPETLRCHLDPDQNARVQRDCKREAKGGPNDRIKNACIPAYRRINIELLPEFSSKYERKVSPDDPRLVVRKRRVVVRKRRVD